MPSLKISVVSIRKTCRCLDDKNWRGDSNRKFCRHILELSPVSKIIEQGLRPEKKNRQASYQTETKGNKEPRSKSPAS